VSEPPEIYVIDTSSVIEVRRGPIPNVPIERIFDELTGLVESRTLVFPKRVVGELKEWSNPGFKA
jgi:hypothetical protein